eukprot:TRINITY_DN5810_c0_g1_i1.p1 TRINITY_DN5810_c0_g1~~TRINITY_DN5810_c0_g1_i1.p1  ORF type:complete len:260 (+),score=65.73 TRINITY_DN5810_c0_g1_i1:198-977(+)
MAAELPQVKAAFEKRRSYIKENLETLTEKALRRKLEEDLGVKKKSLDVYKSDISELVQEVIEALNKEAQNAAPEQPEDDDDEEQERKPTPKKANASARAAPAKPAPPKEDALVAKMKKVCQQATIKISPAVYKKPDRKRAFKDLLAKHGLAPNSGPDEIRKVKAKLERDRELDGIDTANIVDVSRGRRAASRFAIRKPANNENDKPGQSDDDDDEDDDDDGDDNDSNGNEDEDSEAELTSKRPAARAPKVTALDSDDDF